MKRWILFGIMALALILSLLGLLFWILSKIK